MGSNSEDFLDFVLEQLQSLPAIRSARLFGGHCFYSDDKPFALLIANTLYFAVDEQARRRYEAMGSRCFSYRTKQRHVDVKKYYEVPADMLEDQAQLIALARDSIQIARALPGRSGARRPAQKTTSSSRKAAD